MGVDPTACRLCGDAGARVGVANVKANPKGPGGFSAFARCSDAQACRKRREAQAKSWPLIDGTKAT